MTRLEPGIAVLMPVYNPGEALGFTLDSLRRQTVPFRLYLVDDGSQQKPDYHALLHGLDYHLIELPKNLGVSGAANAGLKAALAAGHCFIARMDCGDWCHPQRLELSSRFLAAEPEVDLVGTCAIIDSRNTGSNYLFTPPYRHRELARSLYYTMPFINPSTMARRRLFLNIGLYSSELAEDYELCRRAIKAGLIAANIPYVLIHKIEDASSISVRKRRRQLLSRLRIQFQYRDGSIHCVLGMCRTLMLLLTPRPLLRRMKAWAPRRASGAAEPPDAGRAEKLVGAAGFEPATPTPPE